MDTITALWSFALVVGLLTLTVASREYQFA